MLDSGGFEVDILEACLEKQPAEAQTAKREAAAVNKTQRKRRNA